MQNNIFEYKYRERLKSLADDKKITQNQLDHFASILVCDLAYLIYDILPLY